MSAEFLSFQPCQIDSESSDGNESTEEAWEKGASRLIDDENNQIKLMPLFLNALIRLIKKIAHRRYFVPICPGLIDNK